MRCVSSVLCATLLTAGISAQTDDPLAYLRWTRQRAETIGRSMRVDGRVGGVWDLRITRTERSYNYKLRATLLAPEVIRATARLAQLSGGLSDDETKAMVTEAATAGDLVVMLEIDPREGSGVVPPAMVVLLRPKGTEAGGIRGNLVPGLHKVPALAGVFRRDYAYEPFWAVFALNDERGAALLASDVKELEVVVRIYDKEGRVSWPVPDSLRVKSPR
jgi:hypothetical protein